MAKSAPKILGLWDTNKGDRGMYPSRMVSVLLPPGCRDIKRGAREKMCSPSSPTWNSSRLVVY